MEEKARWLESGEGEAHDESQVADLGTGRTKTRKPGEHKSFTSALTSSKELWRRG
jgi:hypothetical protein